MKILDLEQGTDAWLSWRKTVITATDCSCIMGNNPWTTLYQCWQRKLGLIPEQVTTNAMERGKRLEPIIRDRFIKKFGINMTPKVVESSEYDFLGASLDGLSDCGKYILEIKAGNANLSRMALEGIVPKYYLDQMQDQLLLTGADKCFYHVGSEDEADDVVIEVFPDPEFAKRFIPAARAFLKCIALNEAPPLQDSDYRDMSDEPSWKGHATEYRRVCEQIKNLEEVKESYRKEILKLCRDENCSGAGLKVMKTIMRGRIAYDEIPEIKDIDLDKYRKGPTTTWKIMVS